MKMYTTEDPSIVIYYDQDNKELIKNIKINKQALLSEISRNGQNCNYHTEDDFGLWVEYSWSTGLEFPDHIGGGHILSFCEDWYNGRAFVEVCASWYDSYAEEHNLEKCKDEERQLKDAITEVEKFINHL